MSSPRPEPGAREERRRPVVVRIIARLNVGGPAKHVVWLNHGMRDQFDSLLITGSVPAGEHDMSYFADTRKIQWILIPEMSREISLKDALAVFKVYRILRRLRPVVVHTHTAKAGTIGRVAGLLYKWLDPRAIFGRSPQCVFVHTYHGHIFHSYYGPLKTRLFLTIERLLGRIATDRIIAVSDQQLFELSQVYRVGRPEQFQVVPLGLELEPFHISREQSHFRRAFSIGHEEILIGIIGRLTEVKNHSLFLRAAAIFNRDNPELHSKVRFVVIGEGHLRGRLEHLAAELGLENVLFAGLQDNPEEFYPALDLVALTSLNEGTPLTLIEAMAAGVPVIATQVGGVVDLLGSPIESRSDYQICERGILVSSSDERAFARALAHAVLDRETLSASTGRARQFVHARYSKERLISDMTALYNHLLMRKAVRGADSYNDPMIEAGWHPEEASEQKR